MPFRAGHGDMYLARDEVRKVVKNERRLVGHDGLGDSEPCGHDVLVLWAGVMPQPVQPSALTEELAGSQVILDKVVAEPNSVSLLGREIPSLRFREREQFVVSVICRMDVTHNRKITTITGDSMLSRS